MSDALRQRQRKEPDMTKSGLRFEVKDAVKGLVEAIFCRFNVKDYDGDVILPEAFENGAEVLISAYNHKSWWDGMPVGRGKIRVDADVAVLEGQFWLDTAGGLETFTVVKNAGNLQEYSFGFDVLETGELTEDLRQRGVRRVLKKLHVYEVSPVLVGAGIDTGTLSVKSGDKKDDPPPAPAEDHQPAILKELAIFERTRASLVG